MTTSTRQQFVLQAKKLFAQRGFYGTSIATIANALGLTKQALLHYFGSKEKLYGEVLLQISSGLLTESERTLKADHQATERLSDLVIAHYHLLMNDDDSARLIMRELLDNEQRAEKAGSWYLASYLNALVDTAMEIETIKHLGRAQALAFIYQLLGAAHYFAVSQPTLEQIFGRALSKQTRAGYERELRNLISGRLRPM